MTEKNLIGYSASSEGHSFTQGYNPAKREFLPGKFPNATSNEVNLAVDKASSGFNIYRNISGKRKGEFLNAIADEIELLGDELIVRCCAELQVNFACLQIWLQKDHG